MGAPGHVAVDGGEGLGALSGLRILVTDGEARAALAATRTLGRRGCVVHVASSSGRSLAGASRFAAEEHVVQDARRAPESWARCLEDLAHAARIDAILPISEVSHGNLYRFGVAERLVVACPPRAAYEAAVDKQTALERAAALGIDIPRGVFLDDASSLSELPDSFSFPIVLKSRRSVFFHAGHWHSGAAHIVRDERELRTATADAAFAGGALVQEFVPGHGEGVFLLAHEGETLVSFAHRRIREKPPTGGQSTLRESIAPDPALLSASERLLRDLDFTGVAMLEFRRSSGGRAPLMEINPRLWGSVQLAIDAGLDFPALAVALRLGLRVPKLAPRLGVRSRWLLGDIDHLLISLRRPAMRRERGIGVVRLVSDFLASFIDGSTGEVLRRDDWRPFLRELRAWIRE